MVSSIAGIEWYYFFAGALLLTLFWAFRDPCVRFVRGVFPDQLAYNNVVMATCALLTLIWGAYTFDALQQKGKALAELSEIQKRIKDTEATFLSVAVGSTKYSGGFYLTPVVTIKNSSNEAMYFQLCKDSLSISQLSYNFEGRVMSMCTNHPLFYEMISDDLKVNNSPIYDVRVPISSERNLNFFLPVKESGVYYVTFSALSSKTPNNQKRNGDCSFTQGNNILGRADETRINGKDSIWFASAYIIIKKN